VKKIEDLFIINDGGILLYSWHAKEVKEGGDDLVSGFLSAINTFATLERGEDMKSLKLKETTLIFEKVDDSYQKLTFVITTKNEELIELLHAIVHEIIRLFCKIYADKLDEEFDGEIQDFSQFDQQMQKILSNHGLDILESSISEIDKGSLFKAIIYLEAKGGHIFYIHAKQFVNKDKLSFLAPLIVNSAKLLYKDNLNEIPRWILLNTVRNENLLVEIRQSILIVKQYQLQENFEEEFLSLEFFKSKDTYLKKPKKIISRFEKLSWDPRIEQIYIIDLLGKILFSKILDDSYSCVDYIPETVSFLISSKKASEEIYSRELFNSTIGGNLKLVTICLNFNNFAVIMTGNIKDLSMFQVIQEISLKILRQLK
jgi:hypothetical protein